MASYESYVREGRKLVEQINVSQWELADLSFKVVPASDTTEHNGLKQYAEDIGIDYATLHKYRQVAAAWPHGIRRPREASFSVHQTLASQPKKEKILERLVKETKADDRERVTVNEARQAVGHTEMQRRTNVIVERGDFSNVLGWITHAKRILKDAVRTSQNVNWTARRQNEAIDALDQLQLTVDWLKDVIESDYSVEDVEAFLEAMSE